jgi:broad specificity phosphatase PhoE
MSRIPFLPDDPPTRIYLLRHGEVATFERRSFNGWTDVGLTPRGVSQLEEVASRLSSKPIRAVYTSNLQRSVLGGEAIAKACGVPQLIRPELREKGFGVWEGLTADEASERYPEAWEKWVADPLDNRPESGESYREVSLRVLPAIKKIVEAHPGEEVVVVAHGGVNRVILADVLCQTGSAFFRIEQKYAALNIIDYFKDNVIVRLVNGNHGNL